MLNFNVYSFVMYIVMNKQNEQKLKKKKLHRNLAKRVKKFREET